MGQEVLFVAHQTLLYTGGEFWGKGYFYN
jgi:hypothetical protein